MKSLIICGCRRKFPLNSKKHRWDKQVYCPFCRALHPNPYYRSVKFSLSWIKKKITDYQQKRKAKQFLDKYFLKESFPFAKSSNVSRWSFSLNKWMNGYRPVVTLDHIKRVIGSHEEEIESEINKLKNVGVKVKK